MRKKNMQVKTGKCTFCGQLMSIEVPEYFTEEEINEEVRRKCGCPEAKTLTKREENIASAEGAIEDFFKDKEDLQTVSDIMKLAVEPMINHTIERLSISYGGYSGSMKPKRGEDSLIIMLKYTSEESMET